MTDQPTTGWTWRASLIDRYAHAIPTDALAPNAVYPTACGTGLSDDVSTDKPAATCLGCASVAGPPPRPPVADGQVAWWSGPATGHRNDFSHAFAAAVVNDHTRTTYQALGCDYTVLASQVTPFPVRPLCGRCAFAAAEQGLLPDKGAWR